MNSPSINNTRKAVIVELNSLDDIDLQKAFDFIRFLNKEKKKAAFKQSFRQLQNEFQESLTEEEALNEIDEYRRGN